MHVMKKVIPMVKKYARGMLYERYTWVELNLLSV